MGAACTGVDEPSPDIYQFTNQSSRRNTAVSMDELEHNSSMEDFMSKYRMFIHCNTDPINRSAILTNIVSEFKNEFERDISRETIYDYYNCKY
jgi:hypothetical protein